MFLRLKNALYGMVALALLSGPAVNGSAAPMTPIADARPISLDRGAAETWRLLKKLHTRASLLMIVAHPDDEDGATLAYESRGLGVRTELMTLNRGEGGANVMSPHLWDASRAGSHRRTSAGRPLLRPRRAIFLDRGGLRFFEIAQGGARSMGP